jgi:hypothetical protein
LLIGAAVAGAGCGDNEPQHATTTTSSLLNRAYIVARDSDDVWKTGERLFAESLPELTFLHVSVVVTGRNAPEALLEAADLVTDMRSLRHPFEQGRKAQPGIDF